MWRKKRWKITYLTLWLIPQNSLAGEVEVMGVNVIDPVNLDESVPPKVISPFVTDADVVGSNEIPIRSEEIVPIECLEIFIQLN